jgi:hypothetical protein
VRRTVAESAHPRKDTQRPRVRHPWPWTVDDRLLALRVRVALMSSVDKCLLEGHHAHHPFMEDRTIAIIAEI